MNVANWRKWVEALRSTKYEQCSGKLRNEEGKYCVLGVGCDISGVSTWEERSDGPFGFEYDGSIGSLPSSVSEWLGISRVCSPFVSGRSLINLNDSGMSFVEIADIIEDHIREYERKNNGSTSVVE